MNYCQLGQLVPSAQLVRYVLFTPIGPIGSRGPIGAICLNELLPIGPIGSIGPNGAISTIGPIGSTGPIGAICQNELMPIGPIGSIGPFGVVCPIDANWANRFHGPDWRIMYYVCQLGQLDPRAQLVHAICLNELLPIGPIGSISPIGAISTINANWANWFHGPNSCDLSK